MYKVLKTAKWQCPNFMILDLVQDKEIDLPDAVAADLVKAGYIEPITGGIVIDTNDKGSTVEDEAPKGDGAQDSTPPADTNEQTDASDQDTTLPIDAAAADTSTNTPSDTDTPPAATDESLSKDTIVTDNKANPIADKQNKANDNKKGK